MKWLLPILFIAYYSSISIFVHVHIENGTTIVHSHPFKSSADGTPHHHASLAEFQLFHSLSSIQIMDGAVCSLSLPHYTYYITDINESPVCPDYLTPVRGKFLLRAPPSVA